MGDRITTPNGLKTGDVVMVAVELRDKVNGANYWWRRFCVVYDRDPLDALFAQGSRFANLLTLKLHPDMDKDLREVDFEKDVVSVVEEDQIPQGVAAMRMKLIHTGRLKLDA